MLGVQRNFEKASRILILNMLAAALTLLVHGKPAAAQEGSTPANDACADAVNITLGERLFTTVGATTAGPAVCVNFGRDVWFRFRPTFDGDLTISTCGDADFDTVIAVYSGCTCGSFNLIGCNDDATGCADGSSRLTVEVEADECYKIRIGGFGGDTGTGTLTLRVADDENAASANRIRTGFEPGDRFGWDVAGEANFNGDDNGDIVVGAYRNDTGGTNIGRAYAYRGASLTTLETLTGDVAGDLFGYAVATDCDCNDDGRDDIIVGAPFNDSNGGSSGHIYVFSGADGTLIWDRQGYTAGDRLGWSVGCAGDANDDGFDDVVAGAPNNDANGADAGRAYVFDGADGSLLRTATGQTAGELFGWAVAGIGDLNNDGEDDYAVGAPKYDRGADEDAGRVSIFSGDTGSVLMRISGDDEGDRFGTSVAGARFTAGSTYVALAIGAPNNDAAGTNAGRVKVYRRNISSPGANPCSNLLCLQFTINGGNPGDRFGHAVAVDDLVGTNFTDIIVGAPAADFNGGGSGAVYVFNGASGAIAHRFFGETSGDNFGHSVSTAGDVNGDGDGDLIVGAPYNDAGGDQAGRAYVFFLDDGNSLNLVAGPSAPDNLTARATDLNGDGELTVEDLLQVIAAFGPCAPAPADCPADIDRNGVVDSADVQALLAEWG